MPSINIKTVKLDLETKNLMAKKLYEAYKKAINNPTIEIFFNEYESYYCNGNLVDTCRTVTLEFQGNQMNKEQKAEFCKVVTEIVKETVNDPNFKLSFFYYESPNHDDYAINGRLLSDLFKH